MHFSHFRDVVDFSAKEGITKDCSTRRFCKDEDSIAAANEHKFQ